MRRSLLALLLMSGGLVGPDGALSEVEQLRLNLHKTQVAYEQALAAAGACRAQLRELQLTAEQAALKDQIEQAHPGYVFDLGTGQLTKKTNTP